MSTTVLISAPLLRLIYAIALASLFLLTTRVNAAELYAIHHQPDAGHPRYRLVGQEADVSLGFITADALLCAEVDNMGATRSAAWRIEFSVSGKLIASTITEKPLKPGEHVVICTSNPLTWPHPPITITGRVVHPWDAKAAKGNNTAWVSYGGSR